MCLYLYDSNFIFMEVCSFSAKKDVISVSKLEKDDLTF